MHCLCIIAALTSASFAVALPRYLSAIQDQHHLVDKKSFAQAAALLTTAAIPHENEIKHRNLRETFQDYCRKLERRLQFNMVCMCNETAMLAECNSLVAPCQVNGTEVLLCAEFSYKAQLYANYTYQYTESCWSFTQGDTDELRDGCLVAYAGSLQWSMSNCSLEIEQEDGSLANCGENHCEICNKEKSQGIRFDCTSVGANYTTDGQCLSDEDALAIVNGGFSATSPSHSFNGFLVVLSVLAAGLLI